MYNKHMKKIVAPSVEVHTFTFNESAYIDFFCDWYKSRFTNLKIIVHDNYSTDNTVKKALNSGCSVETFGSPDFYEEKILIALKNSCFKGSSSDYFIVCDIDEFLDLNDYDLIKHRPSLVQGWCWQMFNPLSLALNQINYGSRDWYYDKILCFKRSEIAEINYQPGAHFCHPKSTSSGNRIMKLRRNMFHYRWLSFDHVLERYHRNSKRLAPSNYDKISQWHWDADERSLRQQYRHMEKSSVPLRLNWNRNLSVRFIVLNHVYNMLCYFVKSVLGGYGKEAFKVVKKDLIANSVDLKKYYFPKPWL